jgi:hypothetical protein
LDLYIGTKCSRTSSCLYFSKVNLLQRVNYICQVISLRMKCLNDLIKLWYVRVETFTFVNCVTIKKNMDGEYPLWAVPISACRLYLWKWYLCCIGYSVITTLFDIYVFIKVIGVRTIFTNMRLKSVPITTKVVRLNPAHIGVYSKHQYVIKVVSDSSFLHQ